MTDYTWLQELKAGDTVIVRGSSGRREVRKVQRVTKARVFTSESTSFNKSNGSEVGGSVWSREHIYEATPEDIADVLRETKRNKLRSTLRNLDRSQINALTDSQLERIAAILGWNREREEGSSETD
jgi:hypothetical protein